MRKKRYPFIIAIIILGLIILAAELFLDLRLSFNRSVASVLDGFTQGGDLENRITLLQQENADLRAELFRETIMPEDSAIVYSSYPFNSKSEIIISWGENRGVLVGDAAIYGTSIFVGRVKEVTLDKSVVTTIFDPGFETHRGRYKASELGQVIWYGGGLMDWDNVLGSHRGVDEVDKGQYQEVIKTAYGTGCALFVRRAVFEKVGMLDPKFYLYYEDLDFSMRSRSCGLSLKFICAVSPVVLFLSVSIV